MKVGILGAGQLGRMIALAGYPLGLEFRHLAPSGGTPADPLSEGVLGAYDDEAALDRFADGIDVATYEFENVPVDAAESLRGRVPVQPPPLALEVAQDRLTEKTFFRDLGIATAPFEPVDSLDDLRAACERLGMPAILKTRRWGYDGKGQIAIMGEPEIEAAWDELAGTPLILEGLVEFDRELSVLSVRSTTGETAFYPLVENHHDEGILHRSLAPAPNLTDALQTRAQDLARRVLDRLDYAGVLAIELFQRGDELIANEMAPRVHNSGHWTIEGAATSQFENHLRGVLGLPLGSTRVASPVAMLNLIGQVPDLADLLSIPEAAIHLYGKSPRPGRKLGHVTLRAPDSTELEERLRRLADLAPRV